MHIIYRFFCDFIESETTRPKEMILISFYSVDSKPVHRHVFTAAKWAQKKHWNMINHHPWKMILETILQLKAVALENKFKKETVMTLIVQKCWLCWFVLKTVN
jgi:hypothetical protein